MTVQKIYNLTDHWFPDKIGGSCLYAYKLHRLLVERMETETITLIGEASPDEKNMVVHKVLHKARFLHNRRMLRSLACGSEPIWIVHSPWFFLHLFFAFGFKVRNRVVGIYHGPWFREYFASAAAKKNIVAKLALTTLRYFVEVFYSIYVRRFIFLSEKMHRATSAYLPISKTKVHIIPMWSTKDGWKPPRPKHSPVVLSTFRRLEPRMGLQDMILMLKQCDLENYQINICGDGPYKNELIALIEESDLRDTVKILGWVTEEEKNSLINQSDAVIIPSRSLEGFSLLALESLELGTPVILTNAVGFYEYLRDIEQDFVKQIDLSDPKAEMREFLAKGTARNGLDRIEAIFDAAKIQQAILAVLMPEQDETTEPKPPAC